MIRLQRRGAVYGELWFEEEPPAQPRVDVVLFRQRPSPVHEARTTPFLSLVSDLGDARELDAAFDGGCRYEIRRAEAKDGLQAQLIAEPQARLEEFRAFFDAFAREKGIEPADPGWLRAACRAGQLVLSTACRDGVALVWHAYVVQGSAARLQHSASRFRGQETGHRALVGRANRWLHWQDMRWLKERGVERYDWGGLFADESTPERAGINAFKRAFGGREERSYDCTLPVTAWGSFYLPLRDAWRRLSPAARRKDGDR